MPIDDGPIIDKLYQRGGLKAATLAAEFGDNVDPDEAENQLQDMAERGLVEPAAASPGAWQLTDQGVEQGAERKARMSG